MHQRLQHAHTTQELAQLNLALSDVLTSEPLDDKLLQNIIDERANLVESLLNNYHLEQQRCFARLEIIANDIIIAAVEQQRQVAKVQLTTINKASKAIKKYHQV